jgi:streptogramin lyase
MAQSPSLTQRALRGIVLTGGIVLLWLCAGAVSARASSGATVIQFTLPQRSYPFSLVSVPDGNLWFTAMTAHAIGRVDRGGYHPRPIDDAGRVPERAREHGRWCVPGSGA